MTLTVSEKTLLKESVPVKALTNYHFSAKKYSGLKNDSILKITYSHISLEPAFGKEFKVKNQLKGKLEEGKKMEYDSHYFEIMKSLVVAYRTKNLQLIEECQQEFREFRCSVLEEAEFIEDLRIFIANAVSDRHDKSARSALKDFLEHLQAEWLGEILYKIPDQVGNLIKLFGVEEVRRMSQRIVRDHLEKFLQAISWRNYRKLYPYHEEK